MPFDNPKPDVGIAPEVGVLDAMARRLATPDLWCKDRLQNGASRCIMGALNEADHGDAQYRWYFNAPRFSRVECRTVYDRLNDLAGPRSDRLPRDQAVSFNNADSTTHADILALIGRARALLCHSG